jgi:hypothetical protein
MEQLDVIKVCCSLVIKKKTKPGIDSDEYLDLKRMMREAHLTLLSP